MESLDFLTDLLIAFAVAGGVVFLLHRLRVPAVVGLLIAGMLTGPYGLSLVQKVKTVETLAEIGVVVLLFAVGLEFSLPRLAGMRRLMVFVGVPQVAICLAVGAAVAYRNLGDLRPAIFVGMLLAMSSTAVVFKLLSDRGELNAPQGNVAAAVLLFQDLLVVVCMVALPVLAARGSGHGSLWQSLGLGFGVVIVLLSAGRYVVPFILHQVVRTHNRELFLMALVLICLGSAALTASMGCSLALGAFLAGLALSESEYATQTLAEVLPFRDTLASLFFISVGMLLDVRFVAEHWPLVAGTVAAMVALKFLASAVPTFLAGYPLRIAVLTGLALAQVGEFSFILADRGLSLKLIDTRQYQTFLATAVITIVLTPLFLQIGSRFGPYLSFGLRRKDRHPELTPEESARRNHVIIVGYGLNGRNLARVLRAVDIDYVILELNSETVRQMQKQGEPIFFGDCTRPAVLEHLGIRTARLLVVAISDPASTRRAVELGRLLNRSLHIIVRTRYFSEVEHLRMLGADLVIPEEFETSVEIFAQVLREYELPRNLILDLIERVRADHYEVLRNVKLPATRVEVPFDILGQMEIESCLICKGSPAVDRSLVELDFRAQTGATVVAIRRGGSLLLNPTADERFQVADVVILVGDRPQIDHAICFLDPSAPGGQ